MAKSYQEIMNGLNAYLPKVHQGSPEAMKGFSQLAKSATAEGVLDGKTKELIALSIAISTRCDGCIGFHVKTLIKLGVTKQELDEVCAMAVYMGGGPSLMYAADALRAFDELSK